MRTREIEPDQHRQERVEEERRSGLPGLAVLVGLLAWLGLSGSWWAVVIVLALVVMIFLHELGHYLTAKAAGMKVTEFFLGFGPRLWSFRRGETEYGIKAIPAGAYVKIIGMSNLDEVDPADEERTYRAKPYWRRLSVAVAGSTMHFLLAFVLIVVVLVGFGTEREDRWTLQSVSGPAAAAGLRSGDRVVSLDGASYATFDELSRAVRSRPGEQVTIEVERDGARQRLEASLAERNPTTGEDVGYLGVSPALERVRSGLVDGVVEGVQTMGTGASQTFAGLGRLFSPDGVGDYVDSIAGTSDSADAPAEEDRPTSVIGIVRVGSQLAEFGFVNILLLLFAVNLFIGIFNLTPLLPFDGGHVVIATYEKVRSMISGRPHRADITKLLPLTYAVVLVLALLFITTVYLDIANPMDIG